MEFPLETPSQPENLEQAFGSVCMEFRQKLQCLRPAAEGAWSDDHPGEGSQPEHALEAQHAAEPPARHRRLHPVTGQHGPFQSDGSRAAENRTHSDGRDDEGGTDPHADRNRLGVDRERQATTGSECSQPGDDPEDLSSTEPDQKRRRFSGAQRSGLLDVSWDEQLVAKPGGSERDMENLQRNDHVCDFRVRDVGSDFTTLRDQLERRRAKLQVELGRLTEPPVEGASVGFGKRVGDGTTEAVERLATTATARALAGSIAEIEVALHAIEEGTYGVCEVCGTHIPDERLEARPATARCVDCAV